jgi:UDPglucose 6-dehydrogenase
MQISVIGTGYVGLVTGACFAEFGVNVVCMDNDEKRIARLEKGDVPFYEPGITELVTKGLSHGRLSFTSDLTRAVDHGEVIFIAVGTPPRKDGSADLSFVQEVGRGIAGKMASYKVIVTKSTVPVGTGALLQQVIADGQSKKMAFDVVSNPEFLREGSAIEDFMRPNRVVIGSDSERCRCGHERFVPAPVSHRNTVCRHGRRHSGNDQICLECLPRYENSPSSMRSPRSANG